MQKQFFLLINQLITVTEMKMKPTLNCHFFCFAIILATPLLFPAVASSQVWTYRAGYGQSVTGVNEFGKAICADASGNVYMTGEFAGTVDFGSGTGLVSAGAFDGFVASYTSAGAFRWAIRFGAGATDQGVGIATNGTDVYVTGNFSGSMTVGASATTYASAGSTDAFVIKLSASAGATSWVSTFGGSGAELGQAITVDAQTASANIYVSGTFSNGASGATFGAAGVRNTQGLAGTDLFVAQLNSSGTIVWASTGGAVGVNDNGNGSAICYVPSLSEVVVTGSIRSDGSASTAANYTTASPASSVSLANTNASANNYDFVLLELSATTGAFISGSAVGSTNNEEGLAAAYDASTQDVFFTGYFSSASVTFPGTSAITNTGGGGVNNIFYGRYNPSTNAYTWVREVENSVPASADDVGTGIVSNGSGAIYVTGYFKNTTSFPTASTALTLTSASLDDPFLVKLDGATGNALLAGQGSGDDPLTNDRSYGVTIVSGKVWITGQYAGGLTFSPLTALASSGDGQDIFIAALLDPPTITTHPSASTACTGLQASFTVAAAGSGLSYQWQEATNSSFTTGLVTLSNTGVYSGTTSTTLTISDNTGLNGRYYRAVVTNTGGSVNSNGALLTVTSPTLPPGSATETHTAGTNNNLAYASSCGIISKVVPSGGSPVSGNITSKVWVESSVPTFGGRPYVQRHYQITPASGSTATVTLYFSQAEFDNFNAAPGSTLNLPSNSADAAGKANLRISKLTGSSSDGTGLPGTYPGGGSLIDPPDANIVFNSTFNRWEVTFDVSGFSGFFVQTSLYVLPVNLISFSASFVNNDVQLKWQTADESGNDHFEVEKSLDGTTFIGVGRRSAANGSGIKNYDLTDVGAGNLNNSKIFYRLRIVSMTGAVEYSNTIVVLLNKNNTVLASVMPNPFRDKININLNMPANGELAIKLTDITGKVLQSEYVQGYQGFSTHIITGMEKFASGIYFLSIEFQGKQFIYKLRK
jgi:hypothetical protein